MEMVSLGWWYAWVCLWASWAAAAVHVAYMVLEALLLDMVRRAGQISVHSFSPLTAASADVVGGVVDVVVDAVLIFRVGGLAEFAPAVLWHCCGLSLAAGWMAAASALLLVLRAIAVGCWRLAAASVRGDLADARWHRGRERGDFVSCSSGHGRRGLWSATLCRRLLSLLTMLRAAPHWRSRSVAGTRCCLVLREWLRLGDCTLRWCMPLLLLGGLPVAAATDNHDGQATITDVLDAMEMVLEATFCSVVGVIIWLAILFRLRTYYHQPCQAAVAEEVASEPASAEDFTRAVGVAAVGAVALSEAAEVVPHRRLWKRYVSYTDRQENARKAWKHLRRARYWWQLQRAKLPMRQWRDQMARGDQPAAAETQPAVADRLSAATGDQLAVRKGSRRRHRIRRRANGAPRSCVLESGRWINLPRVRQRVPLMVASISKFNRTRCKPNDSLHGCQRSNCKYPPAGHAPEVDGQDVLDPMVESELNKLRARVSVLEMQMRHS